MPTYQYTAKDNTGKTVTSLLDAESERAAADALRAAGLWPMRIEASGRRAASPPSMPAAQPAPVAQGMPAPAAPAGAAPMPGAHPVPGMAQGTAGLPPQAPSGYQGAAGAPLPAGYQAAAPQPTASGPIPMPVGQASTPSLAGETGGVPLKHLALYFRQLAASVHSGMPLGRCLEIVGQESRGRLARISAVAAQAVSYGETLSSVFARYPHVFSPLVLAMIRAGERGGLLDICLTRIADMLEQQYALHQRISQQTFYPKLLIGASIAIMLGTRFIIGALTAGQGSPFASGFGSVLMPVLGGAVGLVLFLTVANRLGANTQTLDAIKLAMPLVGRVTRRLATARFSRAAAMLYRAGVPLPEVVDSSAEASGNRVFAVNIRRAVPAVQRGGKLSDALAPMGIWPPMAMSMLRTGEETGNIDDMLDKVADYCEAEAETALKQMVVALQPLCVLFIAVAIGIEVVRFWGNYFGTILKMTE